MAFKMKRSLKAQETGSKKNINKKKNKDVSPAEQKSLDAEAARRKEASRF